MQDKLILRGTPSPFEGQYADITQGSVLSHSQNDGNFIYLKGQVIYSAETSGTTISFKKLNGSSVDVELNLITDHNDLTSIQGGTPTERYHLSSTQYNRVLDLIYINSSNTFNLSPSSGERGVLTPVNVNYNMVTNDDIYTAATINNGIGDVLGDINTGSHTVSGGSFVNNITFNLTINYTRKGVPSSNIIASTYTAHIPQWAGVSTQLDFTTYAGLSGETNLQKFIQSSASINKVSSPINQYIWFISNKNNALIQDGNNFTQTTGVWDDGVSEFYLKPLTLTLADGTTTAPVYLYRSRETKTLTGFTYKIS